LTAGTRHNGDKAVSASVRTRHTSYRGQREVPATTDQGALTAHNIMNIKDIIVVQNKVDLVSDEKQRIMNDIKNC
jgi:hypothetical protein